MLGVLLVFAFTLLVYSFGVSPYVFGGDSGDIVLSYFFAGVAHPPGYPLNTLLGFLISHIIPGETFAYRANFVSAIFQALSVALFFVFIKRLTGNVFASLAVSLTLAFVPLFWLYAHNAEVFQLLSVLVLGSLFFLFAWWESCGLKKPKAKYLFLSTALFSFAVFHHHTALLFVPAYLYVVFKTKKKVFANRQSFLILALLAMSGIVSYVFAVFAAFRHTPLNWDNAVNVKNFIQLITRGDYGTFTATQTLVGFSPAERLVQLVWYFKVIKADFTYLGIALAVFGAIYLFIRKRSWFWFFSLAFFFSGPFFLFYASFPPVEDFAKGVSERFVLQSYPVFAVFVAFGMFFAIELISRFFAKKELAGFAVGAALLIFPFVLALVNFPKADLSQYKIGEAIAADALASSDPEGIVFIQGDTLSFNSQYSHYVDGVSKNTKLVMVGRLSRSPYRKEMMRLHPDLVYPEGFDSDSLLRIDVPAHGLILKNYDKVPIYIYENLPPPEGFVWVQEGMLLRLYKEEDVPSPEQIYATIEKKLGKLVFNKDIDANQYRQFFGLHIRSMYVDVFYRNAFEILRRGMSEKSIRYFEKSLEIDSSHTPSLFGMGIAYFEMGDCKRAEQIFESILKIDSGYWQAYEGLGKLYQDCFNDSAKASEYLAKSKELRSGDAELIFEQ